MNITSTKVSVAGAFYSRPRSRIFPELGVVQGVDFSKIEWVSMIDLNACFLSYLRRLGWDSANVGRPDYQSFRPESLWGDSNFVCLVVDKQGAGRLVIDDMSKFSFVATEDENYWVHKDWSEAVLQAAPLGILGITRITDPFPMILGQHWDSNVGKVRVVFDEEGLLSVSGQVGAPKTGRLVQA